MEWCCRHPSSVPAGTYFVCIYTLPMQWEKAVHLPPFLCSFFSQRWRQCAVCVCAEVSSAHLLPWDRGGGEERRAGPAHLGQVLCQHEIHLHFHIGLYAHTQGYISYTTIFSLKNQILIEWFCFTQETIYMRNQIWNVSQRTWNPAAKQALGSSWYFVNSLQVNFSDYALMHITVGISC
jgi:hypothetical protein